MELRNSRYLIHVLSSLGITSCRMNARDWLNHSFLSLCLIYYFQITDEDVARDVSLSITICITEYLQSKQFVKLNCNNHQNSPNNESTRPNSRNIFLNMDTQLAFYLSNMSCSECIIRNESFINSVRSLLYRVWRFSSQYQSMFAVNILNTNAENFLSQSTQPQQLNIDDWIVDKEGLNSIFDIDNNQYQKLKDEIRKRCSGDCPISLENISVVAISDCCWNDFEKENLCQWLKNNYNTCPLCRRRIANLIIDHN